MFFILFLPSFLYPDFYRYFQFSILPSFYFQGVFFRLCVALQIKCLCIRRYEREWILFSPQIFLSRYFLRFCPRLNLLSYFPKFRLNYNFSHRCSIIVAIIENLLQPKISETCLFFDYACMYVSTYIHYTTRVCIHIHVHTEETKGFKGETWTTENMQGRVMFYVVIT